MNEPKPGEEYVSKVPGLTVKVLSYKDPGVGVFWILKVEALHDGLDVKKGEVLTFHGTDGFYKRYELKTGV